MKKKSNKNYYFIAGLIIVFLILTTFVIYDKTINIDTKAFDMMMNVKNSFISSFLYTITSLGSSIGVGVILLIVMTYFIRKKRFSDFKYVIGNVTLGVILMQTLKVIIERVRPSWMWIEEKGFSYPSGHTITSILLYGTLILLVSKRYHKKNKNLIIFIFSLMIFLTGLSRIYFGVHYLTDVIASIILGLVILIISNIFMNKEFYNDKNNSK